MAPTAFVELASALVEAMGQRLDAARPIPEGLVLRTGDGFLLAFLEDPNRVSLEAVQRLFDSEGASVSAVVLTPGHLPLAIAAEVVRRGGTLVEGPRFVELARQLGLETMLGEGPRAPPTPESRRLLPSAQQLDGIVHRARTWLEWGVPALALRFYRQAVELKPEFLPAKVGVGRSLLALGLVADADRLFDEVLHDHPEDLEARMGKAAVLGARSLPQEEVEVYRTLLAEDEARTEVRAHLVAALADLGDWASARVEIEAMLARTPEDPQLRFLHSVALARTGESALGEEEREEARRLGLSYEREKALCQHLGLDPPPRPPSAKSASPAAPSAPEELPSPAEAAAPVPSTTRRPARRARRRRTPAGTTARRRKRPRRSAPRKRK